MKIRSILVEKRRVRGHSIRCEMNSNHYITQRDHLHAEARQRQYKYERHHASDF